MKKTKAKASGKKAGGKTLPGHLRHSKTDDFLKRLREDNSMVEYFTRLRILNSRRTASQLSQRASSGRWLRAPGPCAGGVHRAGDYEGKVSPEEQGREAEKEVTCLLLVDSPSFSPMTSVEKSAILPPLDLEVPVVDFLGGLINGNESSETWY